MKNVSLSKVATGRSRGLSIPLALRYDWLESNLKKCRHMEELALLPSSPLCFQPLRASLLLFPALFWAELVRYLPIWAHQRLGVGTHRAEHWVRIDPCSFCICSNLHTKSAYRICIPLPEQVLRLWSTHLPPFDLLVLIEQLFSVVYQEWAISLYIAIIDKRDPAKIVLTLFRGASV